MINDKTHSCYDHTELTEQDGGKENDYVSVDFLL